MSCVWKSTKITIECFEWWQLYFFKRICRSFGSIKFERLISAAMYKKYLIYATTKNYKHVTYIENNISIHIIYFKNTLHKILLFFFFYVCVLRHYFYYLDLCLHKTSSTYRCVCNYNAFMNYSKTYHTLKDLNNCL
jgi:hypothetical protein